MLAVHPSQPHAQPRKPYSVRAGLDGPRESYPTEALALAARDRLFAAGARSVYLTHTPKG